MLITKVELMRCHHCHGFKQVIGQGLMRESCSTCSGTGTIEDKEIKVTIKRKHVSRSKNETIEIHDTTSVVPA